jgi:hypothetical protein
MRKCTAPPSPRPAAPDTSQPDIGQIARALAEPFPVNLVQCKPGAVSRDGTRAMVIWYCDARAVLDRLDSVVGIQNWSDAYNVLPDGSVVCTLSLRIGKRIVSKSDVGSAGDCDDSNKAKAAFSDALKRAGVRWGIGRYLYALGPSQWVDWNPDRKWFARDPIFPQTSTPTPAPVNGGNGDYTNPDVPLSQRLTRFDAELVKRGLCEPGACIRYVSDLCLKAFYTTDLDRLNPNAQSYVLATAREFEAKCKAKSPASPSPASPNGKRTKGGSK